MLRYLFLLSTVIHLSFFSSAQGSDSLNRKEFVHRSTVMSALLPGLGQMHNNIIKPETITSHLLWKLPIIYGGISASTYFFIYNFNEHNIIKNERLRRIDGEQPFDYVDYTEDNLSVLQSIYRRRRDLTFIGLLGIYLLQLIDANVEAHLFLFDSSDKLTFNFGQVERNIYYSSVNTFLTINYSITKEKHKIKKIYD